MDDVVEIKSVVGLMNYVRNARPGVLVLVLFYTDWCGLCNVIAPEVAKLKKERKDEVTACKVDVDSAEDVARHCRIQYMPTIHFYKGGNKVEEVITGSKIRLITYVDRLTS